MMSRPAFPKFESYADKAHVAVTKRYAGFGSLKIAADMIGIMESVV
jgi:hypothetical protein